eukprot:m.136316 g.136316  ORF g.136316 m.136316 type:complete len:96 (-) comp52470_c0_seq14:7-294(-)
MISSRSVSWLVGRGDLQAPAQIAVFQGAQTGVLFCCRMCAVPFSAGPFKYQRVLELPEENWQVLPFGILCIDLIRPFYFSLQSLIHLLLCVLKIL